VGKVTLLFGAHDIERNNVVALVVSRQKTLKPSRSIVLDLLCAGRARYRRSMESRALKGK
jgi:hypothetical protein